MDVKPFKRITRRLGVFGLSRSIYRALNPNVRAELRNDVRLFTPLISAGDLVFDIGANMGDKAKIFRYLDARVVAVEPNPNCVQHLNKTSAKFGNINVVQAATGSAPGKGVLHFSGTDKTASLRDDWFASVNSEDKLQELEVNVVTLTQLINEFGVPDFCKIDVEGLEGEVLAGLDRQLALLSFEYHKREGAELSKCVEILERLGPWEYNAIEMNGGEFIDQDWREGEALLSTATLDALPFRGDIFARPRQGR